MIEQTCGITDNDQEIVLQQDQDPFFKKNMYLNFGDLGASAKEYVDQYAAKRQGGTQMESIADMKRFVEEYPEFRKLSSNVTKHITLVGELSRRVGEDNLLDVSELEQSLACNDNHSNDLKVPQSPLSPTNGETNRISQQLQTLIRNPAIASIHKLRLIAIYALRYSKSSNNNTPALMELLSATTSLPKHRIDLIPKLLSYHNSLLPDTSGGGAGVDLFQSGSFFSGARDRIQRGLKGVENVYTQHSPRLESILQDLINRRLKDSQFPFVEGGGVTRDKPQDVIVFIVGGATYEEARSVAQINASSPGVRVVLGGTSVHNSTTFLEEVEDAVDGWPAARGATAEERLRREVGR